MVAPIIVEHLSIDLNMSHLLKFLIERVGLFPIFLIGYKHQGVKLVFDYLNFIIFYFLWF
jgi:hypothetical protein